MIAFDVPVKTVSVANKREHWAARAKRAKTHRQSAKITALVAGARGYATGEISVLMVRVGAKRLDDDNIYSALKAVRDGIADALGRDDGDTQIHWATPGQEVGAPSVRVRIWRHD